MNAHCSSCCPSVLRAGAALGTAGAQPAPKQEVATFAGGCFWCTEADFDKVPGVISTTSGFIGGKVANPTYQQVTTGTTGHTEAVEIVFDPAKVTYQQLLDVFWRNHDPLAKDRQFCDRGDMYRPGIFFHSEAQRAIGRGLEKAGAEPVCAARGAHRDHQGRARSTRPRTITRTTTRRIRSVTSSTASTAAAISAWKSCGARRTRAAEKFRWPEPLRRTEVDRDRDA